MRSKLIRTAPYLGILSTSSSLPGAESQSHPGPLPAPDIAVGGGECNSALFQPEGKEKMGNCQTCPKVFGNDLVYDRVFKKPLFY